MIKNFLIYLFTLLLPINILIGLEANAKDSCDLDKCRSDCNEIGMPLRSCNAPTCIPVCGPLDEPSEMFPVIIPTELSEG